MSSNTVLKATDLNKSFSGIVAAKDINVTISQGEIVGIICLLYTSPSPRD